MKILKIIKSTYRRIKSLRKEIIISSLLSLCIVILSYIFNCFVYPLGGELLPIQWLERSALTLGLKPESNIPDSIFLVNVGYDQEVKKYAQRYIMEDGSSVYDTVGDITVTNRQKLYNLLSILNETKSYSYILCDIRFDDGIETDSISKRLFHLISSMDRIVIAKDSETMLADTILSSKAMMSASPRTFLETNHTKFPIVDDGEISIPAFMYWETSNRTIENHGILYFDNNKLCYSSIFPTLEVYLPIDYNNGEKQVELPYKNLGELAQNCLNDSTKHKIVDYTSDKIIVIGDFINDVHDTYLGKMPGALINLNVYLNMQRGRHQIHWLNVILMFLVYFVISMLIIKQKTFLEYLWSPNNRFAQFLNSLIGVSLILITISIISYVIIGVVFDVIIPSLVFSLESLIVKYKTSL